MTILNSKVTILLHDNHKKLLYMRQILQTWFFYVFIYLYDLLLKCKGHGIMSSKKNKVCFLHFIFYVEVFLHTSSFFYLKDINNNTNTWGYLPFLWKSLFTTRLRVENANVTIISNLNFLKCGRWTLYLVIIIYHIWIFYYASR